MLNNPFVSDSADHIRRRLSLGEAMPPAEFIDQAFLLCVGRIPSREERRLANALLAPRTPQSQRDFCHMLLCLNEFLYVE